MKINQANQTTAQIASAAKALAAGRAARISTWRKEQERINRLLTKAHKRLTRRLDVAQKANNAACVANGEYTALHSQLSELNNRLQALHTEPQGL